MACLSGFKNISKNLHGHIKDLWTAESVRDLEFLFWPGSDRPRTLSDSGRSCPQTESTDDGPQIPDEG